MHAMATNLAVWISIVSDETNHALAYERYHHNHSNLKGSLANLNRTRALVLKEVEANRCNITESVYSIFAEVASNATEYLGMFITGFAVSTSRGFICIELKQKTYKFVFSLMCFCVFWFGVKLR